MLKAPDDGKKPDSLEPMTLEELQRLQARPQGEPLTCRDWERLRRMNEKGDERYTLT